MMNKESIRCGLIHLICRESDCGDCLLKNHRCLSMSYDDVVSIARKNYRSLLEKHKRSIFINKNEDMAMEFMKGSSMK